MKLTKSKIIFMISVAVAILLAVANYFFFISVKNINVQASELSSEAEVYENEQTRLVSQGGTSAIRHLIDKISSYFIDKDGVVPFIESIEKEARDRGVDIKISSVGTEPLGDADHADPNKEIMRLKLESSGSWANNLRLVYFIEHLPYKITLVSVNMSAILPAENEKASSTPARAPMWKGKIEFTAIKLK